MQIANKKILSIFAHREDWVLFGWPILQRDDIDKSLFLVCNEAHTIVDMLCAKEDINNFGNAGLSNKFSLQNRFFEPVSYGIILNKINKIIKKNQPDYIFTHNPMGEYGHNDHKYIYNLIYNEYNIPVIITDILSKSSHCIYYNTVPKCYKQFYINKIYDAVPNDFYDRCSKIFIDGEMWTENENLNPPKYPNDAGVFVTNE